MATRDAALWRVIDLERPGLQDDTAVPVGAAALGYLVGAPNGYRFVPLTAAEQADHERGAHHYPANWEESCF